MRLYRQGDVLIIEVPGIPAAATPARRGRGGSIILAEGEVTGHAHALHGAASALLEAPDGRRYLTLCEDAILVHEEHAAIPLPIGVYEVRIQREYSPEAIRQVMD